MWALFTCPLLPRFGLSVVFRFATPLFELFVPPLFSFSLPPWPIPALDLNILSHCAKQCAANGLTSSPPILARPPRAMPAT